MRKIFAFLLLIVLMSFSNQNNSEKFSQSSEKVKQNTLDKTIKIHVDFTITSTGGCSFHVVGDLCYNIWSGHVSCFTGTVTASGSGGCPNGTWNFNWSVSAPLNQLKDGELYLALDSEVLCDMTSITFSGDNDISAALNDTEVNSAIVSNIQSQSGYCGFKKDLSNRSKLNVHRKQ